MKKPKPVIDPVEWGKASAASGVVSGKERQHDPARSDP